MVELTTTGGTTAFAPGQVITGQCSWSLLRGSVEGVVRLFWYTDGRGSQDVGVVEEHLCSARTVSGAEPFSFNVPEGPYSFTGSLITLRWALEFVVNDGEEVARVDLVISPWLEEVVLKAVE